MSYTRSYFHIVFGTKFRARTIFPDRKSRVYAYISNIISGKKSTKIAINGMGDHIHILLDLHPTVALADIVKSIKQSSSKWINANMILPMFEGWGSEYYASSVSPSHVDAVKEYIDNQETHHLGKDYEQEMADFVRKMGMQKYEDEN